ncbi:MAG: helix-turn-helix domain-containing protein [Acidimicrobiia bacterium]
MRLPADQRRIQLIEVARNVFATQGYSPTSMDDIAAAAGVTKPVLYQHFRSKRALYREILHTVGDEMIRALESATASASGGRARVEAGFAAYFRWVEGSPNAFRILFGASVRNDKEFAKTIDSVLDRATTAIAELIEINASGDQRRVLAHALIGMTESVSRHDLVQLSDREPTSAEDLARWLAELAWFGLRGVRP